MKATANVVYYTSKTLANGEHSLMIRYCKDGKKKYKSLGVSVNPQFWNFELKTQFHTTCTGRVHGYKHLLLGVFYGYCENNLEKILTLHCKLLR